MIGRLTGAASVRNGELILLNVGGVGYALRAPKETLLRARRGETLSLETHLVVREDALELYGFESEEGLSFFELLIGVSGIGPRSALAIMNLADVSTLRKAIGAGNASYLTKVSGIGKKSAERIVVELRDKLGAPEDAATLAEDEETLEALQALGYGTEEIRATLKEIAANGSARGTDSKERLREALRTLGSRA